MQIVQNMESVNRTHPNMIEMFSIGKTFEKRDQYALEVFVAVLVPVVAIVRLYRFFTILKIVVVH